MIVHLCLWRSGREVNSLLTGPGPQCAIAPREFIMIIIYFMRTKIVINGKTIEQVKIF